MREKSVLKKAKSLGFPYQLSEENYWQILPTQPKETWTITEAGSRFILSVNNIPQLYLNSEEVVNFLMDAVLKSKNSTSIQNSFR